MLAVSGIQGDTVYVGAVNMILVQPALRVFLGVFIALPPGK